MVYRKSAEEIAIMARGGKVVARVLKNMEKVVKPGITTLQIEKEAERMARSYGVRPAFKGYSGYPSAICVSVNEEVVHGIPSGRRTLREGDIVSLGRIDDGADRLLEVTRSALMKGIQAAVEGNRIGDVAHTVQRFVEEEGYSVVKVFVGHGIGKNLHEEPQVPNFGEPQWGICLKEGMTIAIEPMVNAGGDGVRVLDDGWTAVTVDGSLSAHFEHTIAVTKDGPRILTMDPPAGEGSLS
jgi:methionyl aminopeptidase